MLLIPLAGLISFRLWHVRFYCRFFNFDKTAYIRFDKTAYNWERSSNKPTFIGPFVSLYTVKNHVHYIAEKLKPFGRYEAADFRHTHRSWQPSTQLLTSELAAQ